MNKIQFLSRLPLFRVLPDEELRMLAEIAGVEHESLSRVLSKMRTRRIIEVKGKKIRILDRQKLKKIAAGDRTLFN
jgi:CRP-like cAMP-binding protein